MAADLLRAGSCAVGCPVFVVGANPMGGQVDTEPPNQSGGGPCSASPRLSTSDASNLVSPDSLESGGARAPVLVITPIC